ncbi:unnamed protein product [Sphagnum jensenii]
MHTEGLLKSVINSGIGAAFIMLHPSKYAAMLADKIVGKRMKLEYTWRIIDAIHDGSLLETEYELTPIFNLAVPTKVKSVPSEVLHPENLWANKNLYNETLKKLAGLFQKNFKLYADYTVGNDLKLMEEILAAEPQLTQDI